MKEAKSFGWADRVNTLVSTRIEREVEINGIGWLGPPELLTTIFLVLKLMGFIDWSWWWVFAPIWIPIAFVAAIVLVIATAKKMRR